MRSIEYINLRGNAIDTLGAEEMLILARECQNVIKVNLELNLLKIDVTVDIDITCQQNKLAIQQC